MENKIFFFTKYAEFYSNFNNKNWIQNMLRIPKLTSLKSIESCLLESGKQILSVPKVKCKNKVRRYPELHSQNLNMLNVV